MVYAVEFSHRSGRDLINMASKRPNIVPIVQEYVIPRLDLPLSASAFAQHAHMYTCTQFC